jgi:hypothetical protein
LRDDRALRLAVSNRRGTSPLEQRTPVADANSLSKNPIAPDGLASQPTLSRLGKALSSDHHRTVVREYHVK